MTTTIITGQDAIDYAEANGLTLNKYSDPVDDARTGIELDDDIISECRASDIELLWVEAPEGWDAE